MASPAETAAIGLAGGVTQGVPAGARIGRSARVEITSALGTLIVETIAGKGPLNSPGLRIEFNVSRTMAKAANRAQIRLWNLNRLSRDRISGIVAKNRKHLTELERALLKVFGKASNDSLLIDTSIGGSHVRLFAGYGSDVGLIFDGSADLIHHIRPSNVTWMTMLETGDSATRIREATIDKTYAPGSPVLTSVVDAANAIGASVYPTTKAKLASWLGGAVHVYGWSATGLAHEVLDYLLDNANILRSDEAIESIALGLDPRVRWSVQNGEFVVYGPNDVLPRPPILLSSLTGLVGRPQKQDGGTVKIIALMDARIEPGATVVLDSEEVKGTFRAEEAHYSGDTYGEGSHQVVVELHSLDGLGDLVP